MLFCVQNTDVFIPGAAQASLLCPGTAGRKIRL